MNASWKPESSQLIVYSTMQYPSGKFSSSFRGLTAISGLLFGFCCASCGFAQQSLSDLHASFADPPDDSKIMMRWWWFGPAVTKSELKRELEQMKAAGIGGVEIATLYPQALDDPATGFRNFTYLSDEHIDALRFAADEA